MTRQIIDIGANANDGTGEPLRQAFQAVNDNFANVWAAGPVDSQVVISNNVISTNVDNLELVLSGNGIGTVTVESTVVPMIDSVYDLGSNDRKFDSVYARYFYGNGRYLTGLPGNGGGGGSSFYYSTNPPLNPNIGDVWIESDTAIQYIYFNDSTSNQWAEMEAYQSFGSGGGTGNVDLTDVNSDVLPHVSLLYSIGNTTNQWTGVYAAAIFSDTYYYANGNPISFTPAGSNTQIQFNDQGNLGASSSFTYNSNTNVLNVAGNIEAGNILTNNYLFANGNPISTSPAGGNTQIQFNDQGNLGASSNFTYDSSLDVLGVSGNIEVGNILTNNYLFANGNPISTSPAGGNTQIQFNDQGNLGASSTFTYDSSMDVLGVSGNIVVGNILTDNYCYANGAPVDFEQPAGSNTEVQFNDNNDFGASSNFTYNNTTGVLNVSGNITTGNILSNNITTGNILSTNYFFANGNPISTGPAGSNTQIQFNDQGNLGASSNLTYNSSSDVLGVSGNIVAGNILTNNYLFANGNPISTSPAGSNTQIQFNNQGNLGATANLVYNSDVNQLQLNGGFRINGTITTPSHANINMSVYGTWGGGNNYEWAFDNLGRLVLPTVSNPENGTILANSANLKVDNILGNVVIESNGNSWTFTPGSQLQLPPATVDSTPVDPGFSNQTQKSISGSIDTIAGNPLPSYTTTLSQTETIWTATNVNVTAARMTLRIQYGAGPVTGIEMCDIVVAKEWGTNANVSYVISNRIRTNDSLGYSNVVAALDGSNNLTVAVTNTSGQSEYYSYSTTEFNVTSD